MNQPLSRSVRFRKKPVVIEAVRWTGANIEEVMPFFGDFSKLPNPDGHVQPGIGHCPPLGTLDIPTLEGTITACAGDWIIKGVKGEFYPCKPDIFAMTYEPAEAPPSEIEPKCPKCKGAGAIGVIQGNGEDAELVDAQCPECDGTGSPPSATRRTCVPCGTSWDAPIETCPACGKSAEPKLDRPAQIGATRFGVGVKWSTVIDRAQREYEYRGRPAETPDAA